VKPDRATSGSLRLEQRGIGGSQHPIMSRVQRNIRTDFSDATAERNRHLDSVTAGS
jgi:hypothetical protein